MKKLLFFIVTVCTVALLLSSCAATKGMKKDCQGNKHYKQKGGFYM